MQFVLVIIIIFALIALTYWLFLSPTSQIWGSFPYRGHVDKKLVALTFDDGPNEPYTTKLLELLKQEQVPATFFVVGQNARKYPKVLKRASHEGHTIGNHSLSHQFSNYFKDLSFAGEINQNQIIISDLIGHAPAIFRPPWLFRTPMLLASLKRLGLQPVSGTFVNSLEIFQPSAKKIAATAYRRTKPGTILIFHDGYNAKGAQRSQTITAVDILIKRLRADGYCFTTVDKLLETPAYLATVAQPQTSR